MLSEMITLPDGRMWYVQTGKMGGEIVIPIDQLDGLDSPTIGSLVLSLTINARHIQCLLDAEWVACHSSCPHGFDNKDFDLLSSFTEFASEPEIQEAIDTLLTEKQRRTEYAARRERAMATRRAFIKKTRDDHFITIGNRDGFKCNICGADTNLQLDHVFPVIRGGNNDPSNFQILCRTCNIRKSDSIPRQV